MLLASVLWHILFLLMWEFSFKMNMFGVKISPADILRDQPIVLDIQQPELPNQVVETPEDARTDKPPERIDYLSDKNAKARNQEADPILKQGEAFSKGIIDSQELPTPQGRIGQKQSQPLTKPSEPDNSKATEPIKENSPKFSFQEYLEKLLDPKNPGNNYLAPNVKHDNRKSKALDMGGFSFNTYDWDFAPYLLALKKRIQRNIFPPIAFTQFGMISGETIVRFKIFPSGQMRDLEVLGHAGHISLRQTSNSAIVTSAPFPRLPVNFPEPYLEITGKFMYLVTRPEKK